MKNVCKLTIIKKGPFLSLFFPFQRERNKQRKIRLLLITLPAHIQSTKNRNVTQKKKTVLQKKLLFNSFTFVAPHQLE